MKKYIVINSVVLILFLVCFTGCFETDGGIKNFNFHWTPMDDLDKITIYWLPNKPNAESITLRFDQYVENPNNYDFEDEFYLKVTVFCNDEFIYLENIYSTVESGNKLKKDGNHFMTKNFSIHREDVSKKTWSDIENGTGNWFVQGILNIEGYGNFYFSEDTAFYTDFHIIENRFYGSWEFYNCNITTCEVLWYNITFYSDGTFIRDGISGNWSGTYKDKESLPAEWLREIFERPLFFFQNKTSLLYLNFGENYDGVDVGENSECYGFSFSENNTLLIDDYGLSYGSYQLIYLKK